MAVEGRKKQVRFTEEKDKLLLRHVLGDNPFDDSKRWGTIATSMTEGSFVVDARRVRERTALLLSNFKKEEAANIAKSGEDEEVTEMTVLLQECVEIRQEAELAADKEKEKKRDKIKIEEEQAKDVRKRALEGLGKGDRSRKSQKISSLTLEYLQEKNRSKTELKEKEMELKKRELDLQERRFEMEREEKRAMIELQKKQSEAMLKLMDKLT